MMKIEKYKLQGKLAGWQVVLRKLDSAEIQKTRRFSCLEYGEEAFHKALDWIENQYCLPLTVAEVAIDKPVQNEWKGRLN